MMARDIMCRPVRAGRSAYRAPVRDAPATPFPTPRTPPPVSEEPAANGWAWIEPAYVTPSDADNTAHIATGPNTIAQPPPHRRPAKGPTVLLVTGTLVLVIAITTAIAATRATGSSSSGRYSVTAGAAGIALWLTVPANVGPYTALTGDTSPYWQQYPDILPASPDTTFATLAESYFDRSAYSGIDVDVVYATGTPGHRAVFTLSPTARLAIATSAMYITGLHHFPGGTPQTLLECGTYATEPLCIWTDASTLGLIDYSGTPASMSALAALSPGFQTAIEDPAVSP